MEKREFAQNRKEEEDSVLEELLAQMEFLLDGDGGTEVSMDWFREEEELQERERRKRKIPVVLPILFILCIVLLHPVLKESIDVPEHSVQNSYNPAEYILEEEILLDESRWLGLEDANKIRLLEQFAGRLAEELGIGSALTVCVTDLEGKVSGAYYDSTRTICIDETSFRKETPVKLASIVCHEVRHAYQYELSRAWETLCADSAYAGLEAFEELEACWEGLENYCSFSEDEEGYYSQWIEKDARRYADMKLAEMLGIGTVYE